MCSSFAAAPLAAGTSIYNSVFVFSSTEKALPLLTPLPLADTVVTLPLAHLRIHVLPKNLCIGSECVSISGSIYPPVFSTNLSVNICIFLTPNFYSSSSSSLCPASSSSFYPFNKDVPMKRNINALITANKYI
jgi:hypothetical protein